MSRARERSTAAVILAAAVGVATWVLHERPTLLRAPPPPKPPVQAKAAPAEQPKPKLQAVAIELIDMALLAPPPAPLRAPRQEAPAPVAALQAETPSPVDVMTPSPVPEKALQAEAFQPPAPQSPAFTALKPPDEKLAAKPPPRDTKVLRAAAAEMEKKQTVPAPHFKPLQPGDEKITPRKARPTRPLPELPAAKAPPPQRDTRALIAAAARVEKAVQRDSPPRATPAVVSSEAIGEGRTLLRILEQGSGPGIEIGWPDDARTRNQLYGALKRCLGMRTGLLDSAGRLYLAGGARNQPTDINTDLYSGFVRRPEGAMAAEERSEIDHVRSYHGQRSAAPARLFPRRVDAYLIGGLRQAVGENYLSLKSIHATYRLDGDRVVVEGIVADGRAMEGAIDFSTVANCR